MTQDTYLQILFDSLGFNRLQRNAFLQDFTQRPCVKALDELEPHEKKALIDELKSRKPDPPQMCQYGGKHKAKDCDCDPYETGDQDA